MKCYKYESFYHFVNSFKKALRNHLNVNVTIDECYGEKLKTIYKIYEDEKEFLNKNSIKSPTDLFMSNIYTFSDWDDYRKNGLSFIDTLIEHYTSLQTDRDKSLKFLKLNYYAPTKLERQFEVYEDLYYKELQFTDKAKAKLLNIEGRPGVYRLYDKDKKLVYIGKSTDLGNRIVTSSKERKAKYFKAALTINGLDATIYEAYYIGIEQPYLNSDLVGIGEPSMVLEELDFREIIELYENN